MAASLNRRKDGKHVITTTDGRQFVAKSVLLSPGLHYNRLPELDGHLGKGVHYGTPDRMERNLREAPGKKHVVIVGAGNSGGQAADKLRKIPGVHVHVVSRGPAENYMSDYLIHQRLKLAKNVTFHQGSVEQAHGDDKLTHVTLSNGKVIKTNHVIVHAGSHPRTQWLSGTVEMNDGKPEIGPDGKEIPGGKAGLIRTGGDVKKPMGDRRLADHETSLPGVFAAGDARHGSSPRIQHAGNEGLAAFLQMRKHNERHFSDDVSATRHQTSPRKRLPKKAPPLPKRIAKAKPAPTVKKLAKKMGKGRVNPKPGTMHPRFIPKPVHPQEMEKRRAKMTARAISSLSKVNKKPTNNRVRLVKESILALYKEVL